MGENEIRIRLSIDALVPIRVPSTVQVRGVVLVEHPSSTLPTCMHCNLGISNGQTDAAWNVGRGVFEGSPQPGSWATTCKVAPLCHVAPTRVMQEAMSVSCQRSYSWNTLLHAVVDEKEGGGEEVM